MNRLELNLLLRDDGNIVALNTKFSQILQTQLLLSMMPSFFFTIVIWENLCVRQKSFLKDILISKGFRSHLFNPEFHQAQHNSKIQIYWREILMSSLRLPFFTCLSQVAKLAALSSGLPFVCFTVYAATEKESKSHLVKPDQVRILLCVCLLILGETAEYHLFPLNCITSYIKCIVK